MRTPRTARRDKSGSYVRPSPSIGGGLTSLRDPYRSVEQAGGAEPMALDQSFVGRTYPSTEPYEVGREKIREFAEAVGDTNPAYRDQEAAKALGHPDVIAPPTFVFAISFKAAGQVIQDP